MKYNIRNVIKKEGNDIKKKYYYAIGGFPSLLMSSLICAWALVSGNRGFAWTVILIFPLFHYLLIHTSVTFYEDKVRFKVGPLIRAVDYADITDIIEMKWRRPMGRFPYKAHVLYFSNREPVGLEHNMFTRQVTLEIIEDIKLMRQAHELQGKENGNS